MQQTLSTENHRKPDLVYRRHNHFCYLTEMREADELCDVTITVSKWKSRNSSLKLLKVSCIHISIILKFQW